MPGGTYAFVAAHRLHLLPTVLGINMDCIALFLSKPFGLKTLFTETRIYAGEELLKGTSWSVFKGFSGANLKIMSLDFYSKIEYAFE